MPIVTPGTYIPILYTKRGELSALDDLTSDANTHQVTASDSPPVFNFDSDVVPLFVIQAIDWDFENDEPKRTVDDHLARITENLFNKWHGSEAFLDTLNLEDELMPNGEHPLRWIHKIAGERERTLTPVTSVDRSPTYQRAVQSIAASGSHLCIRLSREHWIQATQSSSDLFSLMEILGVTREKTHLIFDAGSITDTNFGGILEIILNNLVSPKEWASISVAGSSMPASMPSGDGIHQVDRHEWPQYKQLIAAALPRTPSFSDYGIHSPQAATNLDPRLTSPSNNLRYLVDDYWYIAKAGQIKKGGSYPLLAMLRLLATKPEYSPNFSACEVWVDQLLAATAATKAGNPETWRRYGTVRHIKRSTELISTLHGTSVSP
jgi:hypothetical protein